MLTEIIIANSKLEALVKKKGNHDNDSKHRCQKCRQVFKYIACYICQILYKLEYSRRNLLKSANIKFHEKPPRGCRAVPCGRTDGRRYRQVEANIKQSLLAVILWTKLKTASSPQPQGTPHREHNSVTVDAVSTKMYLAQLLFLTTLLHVYQICIYVIYIGAYVHAFNNDKWLPKKYRCGEIKLIHRK
jgi:hypothetical protein